MIWKTQQAKSVARRRVRVGMTVLAFFDAVVGGWALLAPQAFHAHFPGGPFRWISPFGPYNMHLIADIGGAYLMMTALLVLAAWFAERRMVQVALVTVLVQAVPHLTWHVVYLDMLVDSANRFSLLAALLAAVALPAALFPSAGKLTSSNESSSDEPAAKSTHTVRGGSPTDPTPLPCARGASRDWKYCCHAHRAPGRPEPSIDRPG